MEVISVLLIFLVLCSSGILVNSATNPEDVSALKSLKSIWKNTPPSWGKSNDPCDNKWDGVTCTNSRITALGLSSMNLEGSLGGDIASLSELVSLDLSYNPGLSGSVTSQIGNLKKLNTLILAGCRFTGNIPTEIGNLEILTYLALNNNNFSGTIPPTLGRLSNLYWLDLAENRLTGSLPVSTDSTPGLDQLLNTKHFHFNKNQLSGSIPVTLFSAQMKLIHILFDGNQLTGRIPVTLGLVTTLEVLRLDKNVLSGAVPTSLKNLTKLNELHLANNQLIGPIPDLTDMSSLNFVDLSNNSFTVSEAPSWFSTAATLTTLVLEKGNLQGPVPQKLFGFPQLQQVKLKNNQFNGTLDMGSNSSQQLQLVDLQDNSITSVTVGSGYTNALILVGNPVCSPSSSFSESASCSVYEKRRPYTTSLGTCNPDSCPKGQKVVPHSCDCAYPYSGTLNFRAPFFSDLSNFTVFHLLERNLWEKLFLTPGSVILQNPFFNSDDYLQIQLFLFPSTGKYFNRTEVSRIGFYLSNQTYKPPKEFGPYFFIASPYVFKDEPGGGSIGMGAIIGIAVGCVILILLLIGVAIYALRQKKRAEKAIELSKPFASWGPSGKDSGGAPQLKGARWFSYEDLKKCTNNFLQSNEIGSGGYGKVYKGILPNGQMIAIKRAQQGSMQGGHEFKTEIELLSRVHHKNLVGLLGFCFEQGEQMLVYEYMTNGTLRESLSGKSGIHLDWKKRLRITLGSARGLAYLHELVSPPIIHRDVKSPNILLDENLTAKVADFGLSKLVQDSGKGHVSTQVKGTLPYHISWLLIWANLTSVHISTSRDVRLSAMGEGYLDPEYYMTQQLTEKSDVYSFGVVMLELITSRQPIEKNKYIVREVRTIMDMTSEQNCGLTEIMDPSIRNETKLIGFRRFLELAMQCVEESAADRPTMSDLVKEIETILQNDGLNTNSTSASSSATEFTIAKGVPRHPYNDTLPKNEANSSNSFDYSGGYTLSAKVEPK